LILILFHTKYTKCITTSIGSKYKMESLTLLETLTPSGIQIKDQHRTNEAISVGLSIVLP